MHKRYVSVVKNNNGLHKLGFGELNALSEGLKKLLFKVIMRKRNILTYGFRGNVIIRDLYAFYNKDEHYKFLSPELNFPLPKKKLICLRPRKSGQWLTIFQV